MRRLSLTLILLLVATSAAADPPAEPTPTVEEFDYRGRRFGWWDYFATAWTLGAFYAVESGLGPPQRATWTATIPPFDEPMRDLLAAKSRAAREQANDMSDYFWYAAIGYPVLASAVLPPVRGARFDMVWQLEMMNLQAFAVVSLLVRIPHKLIGRARPNNHGCAEESTYDAQCDNPSGRYVSFPGGHVAVAMTGAGLTCAHHLHADLFGVPAADASACVLALLTAETVGLLRLRADKHWFTDHMIGAATGFGIGYGLPTLLYYHPFWRDEPVTQEASAPKRSDELRWTFAPQIDGDHLGLSLVGSF